MRRNDPDGGDVVYDWDLVSDEIEWGPNLAAVLGLEDCSRLSTGLGYAEHLSGESPSSRHEAIMAPGGRDTGGGVPFTATYGLLAANRSSAAPIWIEDAGRWFADATDRPVRAHGVIRVITERFEAERALAATQRDAFTGAFTRAHFVEQVSRRLSLAARRTSTFAVLLIAVERVGATGAIDEVAMTGAMARLREQMRSHEIVARHAAGTVAVLLETCNAEQAAAAAARFSETTAGMPALRARIGIALAPGHGRTPEALLRFAEDALEERQPTSPSVVRAEPATRHGEDAEPAVPHRDEIVSALNECRVALALQPIVDARTRAIVFHEGLVRIKRLDGTLMLPDAMVPVAEKCGLVALIDRRVLDLAFSLLTADRKLVLSINASVASLHETGWFDHLRAACRLRPDAARRLIVEITETRAIADVEATRTVLAAIKPLGVKIAIDDFGSGHSSFRNLRHLPIDYLKIDGAFARNLATSPDDRFFIRTLIDLARNLRIPTIAEWIEDETTARILGDWGVEYLQGHLFGKAEIPAASMAAKAAS